MSLFSELKRRNVFRVGAAYAVIGWLILQIGDVAADNLGFPGWFMPMLFVLLGLGFPVAVFLAWAFELTPDGMKRTGAVQQTEAVAPPTGKRMDRLIVIGLLAVIAVLVAERVWFAGDADPDTDLAIRSGETATARPEAPATPSAAPESGLIAVLPFRNRSVREEDAFFAEGVHDDLLTQLSKVAAFKVISRTSMMRYADSTLSIPQIAAELGAAVVLEGAVQRAGDQVRVNVQLIDGASDVYLWAENYDRALTTENIFAIQADIAQAVADAMQLALSPEESRTLRAGSTQKLEAYEAFLRGKLSSGHTAISAESSRQAIAAFDRAIALDPNFAEAWARKAQIQLISFWLAVGPRSLREDARLSLAEAQRLAPDNIETLMAQAYDHYLGDLDYARADATLRTILARVPDHAEGLEASGYVARRDGRFDDAFTAFERALVLDPQAVDVISSLAEMLYMVRGEFDAAETMLQRARRLGADTRARAIWIEDARGDLDAAWAEVDGPLPNFASAPAWIAIKSRDPERIAYALSPAIWPEDQRSPGDFPEAYAMVEAEALLALGRRDEADRLLATIGQRLAERSDPYPSRWLGNAYYHPSDLPGMLGDLEGVRAAEADFLDNARRDAWGSRSPHSSLAKAFARAGDPERALHYLERMVETYGPHTYLEFSSDPGLDSLRDHPRFLALKAGYENWRDGRRNG